MYLLKISLLEFFLLIRMSICIPDTTPSKPVQFYYYPNVNQLGVLVNETRPDKASLLRVNESTFVIVDGFLSNRSTNMSANVKNSLLKHQPHSNVIVLDWSSLSGSEDPMELDENTPVFYIMSLYNEVKSQIEYVASKLTNFLASLKNDHDIDFANIHLIGFSLGAHIAGVAGLEVTQKFNRKIGRITALDPAGIGFPLALPHKRLDKGDAEFVDVYFTNRYTVGDFERNVGHVDVFVNGGKRQPGCNLASLIYSTTCNHAFSWRIWNTCMNEQCKACPCDNTDCQNCSGICPDPISVGLQIPLKLVACHKCHRRGRGSSSVVVGVTTGYSYELSRGRTKV